MKKVRLPLIGSIVLMISTALGIVLNTTSLDSVAYATEPTAICQGVANDENNNIAETTSQGNPVPIYRTLLAYDVSLGTEANTTNVVSTIGSGIKLNGTPLSAISNTRVDYANGSKYIRIKIPQSYQDSLEGEVTLEVEAGTIFEGKVLNYYKLVLQNNKWRSLYNVSFDNIQWNNKGYDYYKDMKGVLIGFNKNLSKIANEYNGNIRPTNFVSTIGDKILLGGIKISELPGAFVSYHSTTFLFIYCENMPAYRTLKIVEDTVFLNAILPELNLYFAVGTDWSTTPNTQTNVSYNGIQWNDTGYDYYVNKNGVLLKFSGNLSKYQTEIDAGIQSVNFAKNVGEHIFLGGKKLSTLPGALVSYHSQYLLFIYCDNMPSYRSLKIEDGTIVLDAKLPEINLYYSKTNHWSTEKEPAQNIEFSNVFWNNDGRDVYEGKKGILLSYSDVISNAPSEINGDIKLVNHADSTFANKIKFDDTAIKDIKNAEVMYFGLTFLWIYVPNMDSYKIMTMESTEFLTSILPSLTLGFFDGEWAEVYKIVNTINGATKVDYCRKDRETILSKDYYSSLFSKEKLSLRLITFKVGSKIYSNNEQLVVNDNLNVDVVAVGFETTRGAAIKMSEPSNIRFETKINKDDYDYLVGLYGKANIEIGTYVVPKDDLYLMTFDKYFNDSSKVVGVDYVKTTNQGFLNELTASSDGFYRYLGAFGNILPNELCTEYCGIGYLKINTGSSEITIYGGDEEQIFSRSVFDVAKVAYKNYAKGTYEREAITKHLDSILSLVSSAQGIDIENYGNGYRSPYVVNYNRVTEEYTISGEGEIKTVLINGVLKTEGTNLVDVNGETYMLSNYALKVENNRSNLTFKLIPAAKAASFVDFVLQFPENHELKILQLTDTQIIDSSQMRSADRLGDGAVKVYSRSNIDINCFNHIAELVEKQQPDLILFTGDVVYGEFDDSGEILLSIIEFMDSLGVPWAPVFGNHDNESYKGVNWQCKQFENAQNCLFKQGNLSGNGNYSIGLTDKSGKIKRVIYMMDTQGCKTGDSAGLRNDQIAWMKNTSNSISKAYGENVPAFIGMHIPTLDFKNAYMNKYKIAENNSFNIDETGIDDDYGQKNEKMSLINTSFASDFKEANVDGVFAGHDHVNNFSILYEGIRYTYGTKTGLYDYYNNNIVGGTLIRLSYKGSFKVSPVYLNSKEMEKRESSLSKFTVFSDLHHDERDDGGFYCTKAKAKLNKIVSETQSSSFYISLGDIVNSCADSLKNYYEIMNELSRLNLNIYNSNQADSNSNNRMIYNLLGNHEVAYLDKPLFKDYVPYAEGVGSTGVFKRDNLMFVAVDALFNRSGSDKPSDLITTTEFMISNEVINYLKKEVKKNMDDSVQGIVWISHVALKDIDETSKGKLLNELKNYELPMTVFEGHTHSEAYYQLIDTKTSKAYCDVYTLPAVTLNNGYPYYNVTFKNGKVWAMDKRTGGVL